MKRFWLQFFTWWNGETLGTRFWTWRKGEFVGDDEEGNRYYRERGGERRWVVYNGIADPSRIPPGWNAWIHFRVDETPGPYRPRDWELPHEPNLTGTAQAYRPTGSVLNPHPQTPGRPDYEPWRPT